MDSTRSSDGSCVIPKSEKDITDTWISKTVGMTPLPNTVSVVGNIQDGVGFLSNLCRVSFRTEEKGVQNILVKLLPVNPEFRALTLNENFDEREIQFYKLVKPKIVEVVPAIKDNLCEFYCGETSKTSNGNPEEDYGSMLIMEDLKPLGYQMLNPDSDKWQENLKRVVQFMAKFHCASLAVERALKTPLAELFPFCMGVGDSKLDTLLALGKSNITRLDPFLEQHNGSMKIREAYKEIEADYENNFVLVVKEVAKNSCLVHGDIWPPNIMIADDPEKSIKVIDWQILGYRNPMIDLTVAILSCLPKTELKRENVDKMFETYFDAYESQGSNLKRSDFQEFFHTWGMAYAYFWYVLSFDAFPNDPERLKLSFEFIQTEYKVVEFFKKFMKQ